MHIRADFITKYSDCVRANNKSGFHFSLSHLRLSVLVCALCMSNIISLFDELFTEANRKRWNRPWCPVSGGFSTNWKPSRWIEVEMIRQAQSLLSAYGGRKHEWRSIRCWRNRPHTQQHIETHSGNQQKESYYPFNWIGSLIGLMVAGKQSCRVAKRSGPLFGQLTSELKKGVEWHHLPWSVNKL